ncbi:carbamoyltransferase C-terminal domain-containing protein [candidate division CSSED10-310 bacterium]|uniref:Carbamoyltransferase C-terminal domain-containing protein n=1 Tax=candidate division CSSED10-310 bacterium TaxID=2855610 RepID=A0ABV6YSK0_UNCC1
MTIVLGLSISHYTSACIVADGEVKAAIIEERLSRKKFDACFPHRSLRKVIEVAGVSPQDIDCVAVGSLCEAFDPNLAQENEYRFSTTAVSFASRVLPVQFMEADWLRAFYRKTFYIFNSQRFFRKHSKILREVGIDPQKVKFYDHHSCHSATAYYSSPWRDRVLLFTCDGNGDGYCGSVGIGQNERWEHLLKIPSIHSLGGLFGRTTRFIGMKPWQDEYKVMGLAPWGARKNSAEAVFQKFKKMWGVDGLRYRNYCGYACGSLISYMNRTFEYPRFDHVAYGVQRLIEETLAQWVKNNMEHHQEKKIGCAGGVFYNIKANKYIVEQTEPEDVFIFPTSGDESTSVGAAFLAYEEIQRARGLPVDIKPLKDVYWGQEIDTEIEKTVATLDREYFQIESVQDIAEKVAALLAENKIVGVCNSRMEFCPRALGNRSILANPSDLRNVERLNSHIKRRDFWMPFALTVLKECEHLYVENPHNLAAHYMIMGFDTKPARRDEIIAGIHQADKTVRPQILEESYNPYYHRIVKRFHEKTNIGAVLNTSLNLHGDPMINLPSEAIELMLNSELKYLALGNYLITRTC